MEEPSRLLWLVAFEGSVVALILLCDAMLPGLTRRARETASAMPARSFLVGLINLAFFGLVAVALFSLKGVGTIIGGALALAVFSVVALGLTVAARLVAARLVPARPDSPRSLLGASGVLLLASSAPLVGWFVVLPLALCIGCGATIIGLLRWRTAAESPPVAAPSPGAWSYPAPPRPPTAGGSASGPS